MQTSSSFSVKFEQILHCVSYGLDNRIIVIGYFNFDLLHKDKFSCRLINLSFNCYPTIYIPTHAVTANVSILNNKFVNFPVIVHSGVVLEQLSGHLSVITIVELPKFNHNSDLNNNLRAVRRLTKNGFEHTHLDLLNTGWSFITETSNVNEDNDKFNY